MAIIRTASVDDAAAICTICSKDLGYPCHTAMVADKIRQCSTAREAVFVAWEDSAAVGFIHVETYDVLYFETMANILGLAVKAEYRHRGIGKQLILAAEQWAAERSIKAMRLRTCLHKRSVRIFEQILPMARQKSAGILAV